MVHKFSDKKSKGSGANNEMKQNEHPLDLDMQQLAEELHKPFIKKLKKRRVYFSFKDNIWGADLADMQLISKFTKGIRFLLCVDISIVNTFQKLNVSVGNRFGRNCIIFGVDMSFSVHVNNKKKDILILVDGPTQGLDGTIMTTEKLFSITCLNLHYNESLLLLMEVVYLLMVQKLLNLKQKILRLWQLHYI